jgi:hypothetical protein
MLLPIIVDIFYNSNGKKFEHFLKNIYKKMQNWLLVILTVFITLLIVALIVFVVIYFIIINYENKFYNDVNNSFKNFCASIQEFNYKELTLDTSYDGILYSGDAAYVLLSVAYATSYSNCNNLQIPLPNGFQQGIELKAEDSSIIYGQIYSNYATGTIDPEYAIISFSGTLFVSQWMEDFKYQLINPTLLNNYTNGIQCHTGFYQIYISIRNQIWKYLNSSPNLKTIFITGHSLGGALSSLCSFDLFSAKSNYKIISYSFASPRVGNNAYASFFNTNLPNVYRVNNTEDLITDLPPSQIGNNVYCHTNRNVPFTVALDNLKLDHTEAYVKYMPTAFNCIEVSP